MKVSGERFRVMGEGVKTYSFPLSPTPLTL